MTRWTLFGMVFLSMIPGSALALQAGFSEVPFELPDGSPLGGYGTSGRRLLRPDLSPRRSSTFFRPSLGTADPVRSKAMVVKSGSESLAFVSLDLVGISAGFRADLIERLAKRGFKSRSVLVSATHTHSGPGALSKNPFWALVALDLFQKRVYEAVMEAAVLSVLSANARSVDAGLFHSKIEIPGVQRNRRGHPERMDRNAHLLVAKSESGAVLGTLINFAIHGIAHDDDHLLFSADVPGGIESAFKNRMLDYNSGRLLTLPDSPVAVFINGAEGDISPTRYGRDGIETIGAIFAEHASPALESGRALPDHWDFKETRVSLPTPGMNYRNCVREFNPGKPNRWLALLSRDASFRGVAPFFPKSTRLTRIQWGPLSLLSWPGEPTAALGAELRDLAIRNGAEDAMILGLTNDHLAYFVTPEEFAEGGYEACFTFYGRNGASRILDAYRTRGI